MELLKGNKTVRWVTPVNIPAYLPICISISPVLTSGRCRWSCPWKSWWSCAGWVSQGDWTASWSDLRHLAPPEVFGPSHIAVAASTQPPSAGNVSDTLQSPPERSGGQTWRDDGLGWFDRVTQSVHRYLISHLNTPVEAWIWSLIITDGTQARPEPTAFIGVTGCSLWCCLKSKVLWDRGTSMM